jgi:hypothetical protein
VPEEQQAKAAPAGGSQDPETGQRHDEDRDGDRGGRRDEVSGAATLISTVLVGVGGVYATTRSGWVTAMATVAAVVIVGIYLVKRSGGRR